MMCEPGNLKWIFHTIPHPGEKNYETWPDKDAWKKLGGANDWSGMSLDEERGIVYIPHRLYRRRFLWGLSQRAGFVCQLFAGTRCCYRAIPVALPVCAPRCVGQGFACQSQPCNHYRHNGEKIDAVAQITKQGLYLCV